MIYRTLDARIGNQDSQRHFYADDRLSVSMSSKFKIYGSSIELKRLFLNEKTEKS